MFPLRILLLSQFDIQFRELAQNTKSSAQSARAYGWGPGAHLCQNEKSLTYSYHSLTYHPYARDKIKTRVISILRWYIKTFPNIILKIDINQKWGKVLIFIFKNGCYTGDKKTKSFDYAERHTNVFIWSHGFKKCLVCQGSDI